MPPRVVRIIANPISGKRGPAGLLTRLTQELRSSGIETQLCITRGAGDATRLASEPPRPELVIVVGGDGTVREAAAGLVGSGVPMLIAPRGTENLVARQFHFSAKQVAQTVRDGRAIEIDVATANGVPFLVVAGLGFDAEVVRRVAAARNGHITHMSYLAPLWRTFWSHRFAALRVEADGARINDEPAMVFVGNIPQYAMRLPVLRDADERDGLLDVCVFRCSGRMALLAHAWRTVRGRHVESPGVVYQRATTVRIWSETSTPVELDGDLAPDLRPGEPLTISVRPAALRLWAPGAGTP